MERFGHLGKEEIMEVIEEFLTGANFTTKRKMREAQEAAKRALSGAKNMQFMNITGLPAGGLKAGGL